MLKKAFWVTLILCIIMPMSAYAVIGDECDFDKDGDVDGEDLAIFTEYYGKTCWYKDADGDGYSDGTNKWKVSKPEGYYPQNELIALSGDLDDNDPNIGAPVKIENGTIYYYSLLQDAYDAAADDDTIQVISVMFIEDLFIDRNISVTLQGGYSNDFTATTSTTTLLGDMTIDEGTLIIENFEIVP